MTPGPDLGDEVGQQVIVVDLEATLHRCALTEDLAVEERF